MPSEPTPRIPEADREKFARELFAKYSRRGGTFYAADWQTRQHWLKEADELAPLLCAGLEEERDKLRREADGTHELLAHFRDERAALSNQLAEVRAEVEAAPNHTLGEGPREKILAILDSSSSLSGDGEERGEEGRDGAFLGCGDFEWKVGEGDVLVRVIEDGPGGPEATAQFVSSPERLADLIYGAGWAQSKLLDRSLSREPGGIATGTVVLGLASTQPESPGNSGEGDQRVVFEFHPECLEGENVREFHPEIVGAATGALRTMLGPEKDERAYRDADVLASCAVSEALKALVTVANLTQPVLGNSGGVEEGSIEKLKAAVTRLQATMFLTGSPPKDQDEALADLAALVDALGEETR